MPGLDIAASTLTFTGSIIKMVPANYPPSTNPPVFTAPPGNPTSTEGGTDPGVANTDNNRNPSENPIDNSGAAPTGMPPIITDGPNNSDSTGNDDVKGGNRNAPVASGIASIIKAIINNDVPNVIPNGDKGTGRFPSNPTSFIVDGVTVNAGPSAVVIGDQTIASVPSTPTTIVANGKTLVYSSGQIVGSGTTVPVNPGSQNGPAPTAAEPSAMPAPVITSINGIPVGKTGSSLIIGDQTITPIPPAPTTIVANGHTLIYSSGQIFGDGTTVLIDPESQNGLAPTAAPNSGAPASVIINGIAVVNTGSSLIVGDQTITPIPSTPTTIVANGQTLVYSSGQIAGDGTTVNIVNPESQKTAEPDVGMASPVIINGIPVLTTGSSLIIGDQTITPIPPTPTTIVANGQTLVYSSGQIAGDGTTVNIANPESQTAAEPNTGMASTVIIDGIPVLATGSSLIIGDQTITSIPPTPTTIVANGHTLVYSSGQIVGDGTTVLVDPGSQNGLKPTAIEPNGGVPTSANIDGIPILNIGSSLIIGDQTITSIPSTPTTIVSNGHTLVYSSGQIFGDGTTVLVNPGLQGGLPPVTDGTSGGMPTPITVDGIPVRITGSSLIFGDQTIPSIPPTPTTVVVSGHTFVYSSGQIISGSSTVPIAAMPTSVTIDGIPVRISGSYLIIGDQIISPLPSMSTTFVVNGHTLTYNSGQIIDDETTIPLVPGLPIPTLPATFNVDGIPVRISGSSLIIGDQTITPLPSMPTTFVVDGHTLTYSSGQIIDDKTTAVLAPGLVPTKVGLNAVIPTSFTVDGIPVRISGSSLIIGDQTITSLPSTPTTFVINGHTIVYSSGQIIGASTTIPLAPGFASITAGPIPMPTSVIIDGVLVRISGSSLIIGSQTITPLPSTPATFVVNGHTIVYSSGQIIGTDTTIPLAPGFASITAGPMPIPMSTVIDGIPVRISGTTLIIGDQTITSIPPNPTSVIVNGKTLILSSGSIIAPDTTVPIFGPNTLKTSVVDGVTFTIGPTIAIISGKTYTIGPGATATTTVIDGKTLSIGPEGVGVPTTTVAYSAAAASYQGPLEFSGSLSALFLMILGLF